MSAIPAIIANMRSMGRSRSPVADGLVVGLVGMWSLMSQFTKKLAASALALTLLSGVSACSDADEDPDGGASTTLPDEFVPDPGTTVAP